MPKMIRSREHSSEKESLIIRPSLRARDLIFYVSAFLGADVAFSMIFYDNILFAIPGLLLLPAFLRYEYKEKEKKNRNELIRQFPDLLHFLSSNLRAGYSLENAFAQCLKNLELIYEDDDLICIMLKDLIQKLSYNMPVEKALAVSAKQSGVSEICDFVEVFIYTKRIGGNMVRIIRNNEEILREKNELERDIEAAMAGKRFEFKIMMLMPIGILLYMKICFADFMDNLYGNAFGVIVMSAAALLMIASFLMGKKIIEVTV